MKIDRVRSCCSKTGSRRRKRHKTFKIHLPTAEQYSHQVNIMLLELDLRMLLYFFSENYQEDCQNNVLNYSTFYKTDPFPQILRLYDFFLLIMRSDAARGQLCEIAPAHNIRIPGLTICQGSVKIISLNRDIVIAEFPVQRYCEKFSKNIVILE